MILSKRVPTPTEIELTAEIESLHGEIQKLELTNSKLRDALKAKVVVTKRIKKRVGLKYFPALVLDILHQVTKDNYSQIADLYVRYMSLVNYAIVAGVGVIINMFVLYGTVTIFPLFMANGLAILTAFLWNWTFSVGPMGYLMGLQPEVEEEQTFEPTT
jgi:regulator of replication initiation timing